MRSLVLKLLFFLLLITIITFVVSLDLDHQAGELIPNLGGIVEPSMDIASEAQQNEANDGLELFASNDPTLTTGDENSESPLFQSGNDKCSYNHNQPSSRRARSKRGEICRPSRDDTGQPVQNSGQAEREKENPGESPKPGDSPVDQSPLSPYKDRLLCPLPLAPWPVCGTVDSFYIHYQIIYPVTNAPMGWWIHEYCVPGVYLVYPRRALSDSISLRRKQILKESWLLIRLVYISPTVPTGL